MTTRHAEYKTEIGRLAEDSAKRDAEAAKRDKDNLRFQIGLAVAIVVVLGVLIRWPG